MNFKLSKLFDADGDLEGRWFVYYYFRIPETGKWKRFKTYLGERYITRPERYNRAKELRKSIDQKLLRGFNPFASKDRQQTSIDVCLKKFIENRSLYLRERTLISYRSYLRNFEEWLKVTKLQYTPVEQFSYTHAMDYMEYYGSKKRPRPRTWNNNLQTLQTCFSYLLEKEFIQFNPFSKIHKLPEPETEIIAFTEEELATIRNKLPQYNFDLWIIALLIFNCFLRPQEIVRLQVRHLKGVNGRLYIPGTISKNKKNETIAITPQLQLELQKMDMNYPGDFFVFGRKFHRSAIPIFPTRIAEAWKKFALESGIGKSIYALKHTANGLAVRQGANARDLQLQNRHSSLEETQKYLDRFSREPSQAFINRFPTL